MKRLFEAFYRKANQVLAITALGLMAVFLGTLGFDGVSMEPFFKAVGFLVVDGFGVESKDVNGWLILARLFSLAMVSAATVALLWHYVGNDLILRWRRDHCVVIGAGWKGHKILEELAKSKPRPVVVDPIIDEGFSRWCRVNGIGMVHGDATERKNLELAAVHKARKVYIFCGNDEINLQVANLLGDVFIAKSAKDRTLDCYVELSSQRNFRALSLAVPPPSPVPVSPHNPTSATKMRRRVRARLINVENATVRSLLEKHRLDRFEAFAGAPVAVAHVVVLGDTSISREILRQAMQLGHYEEGRHLHISVLTPDPRVSARSFTDRYPSFQSSRLKRGCLIEPKDAWVKAAHILPTITFHELPIFEESLLLSLDRQGNCQSLIEDLIAQVPEPQAVTVFIATGNTPNNVNYASCLARPLARLQKSGLLNAVICTHITARNSIYLKTLQQNFASKSSGGSGVAVFPFEDFMGDHGSDTIEGTRLDFRASRIWHHYSGKDHELDFEAKEKWLEEIEEHKDSNRQAADHALVKSSIRGRIECLLKNDSQKLADSITKRIANCIASRKGGITKEQIRDRLRDRITRKELKKTIGQIEHRRWCAEKLLKGFSSLTKFPANKADIPAFALSQADLQNIFDWLGWNPTPVNHDKKGWQARRLHLDLIPFHAIEPLILATGHPEAKKKANKEVRKDQDQVAFVLTHLEPAPTA